MLHDVPHAWGNLRGASGTSGGQLHEDISLRLVTRALACACAVPASCLCQCPACGGWRVRVLERVKQRPISAVGCHQPQLCLLEVRGAAEARSGSQASRGLLISTAPDRHSLNLFTVSSSSSSSARGSALGCAPPYCLSLPALACRGVSMHVPAACSVPVDPPKAPLRASKQLLRRSTSRASATSLWQLRTRLRACVSGTWAFTRGTMLLLMAMVCRPGLKVRARPVIVPN